MSSVGLQHEGKMLFIEMIKLLDAITVKSKDIVRDLNFTSPFRLKYLNFSSNFYSC